MTTTSIPIHYPSVIDRGVARLGRALLAWADDRATVTHERHTVAVANEHARLERERVAAASQFLRG